MPNTRILDRALEVAAEAVTEFCSGRHLAVVCQAVAGAGKSQLVVEAAGIAASGSSDPSALPGVVPPARPWRVLVVTPTNAQCFALVRRIAQAWPDLTVAFVPAQSVVLPDEARLPNVVPAASPDESRTAPVVVATFDKVAYVREQLGSFDGLIADEAYQADSERYLHVSGVAEHHLLVGDPGQLDPFTTIDATEWRGISGDPLQTAVGVLLRNHPGTPMLTLPLSRRLSPAGAHLARPFYPGIEFEAATLAGERNLQLAPTVGASSLDDALDLGADGGSAYLVLPPAPALIDDPETAEFIVGAAARLVERAPRAECERYGTRDIPVADIAVVVSHNAQKDLVRNLADERDLGELRVDTANRLQGLEFDLVLAWHPLSALPEADEFHLDVGRLCVMLTRHRQACYVFGRADDVSVLDRIPPSGASYVGIDEEVALDGWAAHREVLTGLNERAVWF